MLRRGLEGDPPPPALLQGLSARVDELLAVSLDPSAAGIERWLTRLRELVGDQELRETLVVRALQMQFPRLAEALTLIGVVGIAFDGNQPRAFSINWAAIDTLLRDPGGQSLALLLSRAQQPNDLKALQALALLLIAAPRELLALEYARQGFAALPLGGEPPGASLQDLLDLINSPLRLPLPFALPLTLEQLVATAQQPPGPQGSLATLGPDAVPLPGLDGLGLELALADAQLSATRRVELGGGWALSVATADAGPKTYRLLFSGNALSRAARPDGDLSVLLGKAPGGPADLLVGEPDGTHLAIQQLQAGLRFRGPGAAPGSEPLFELLLRLRAIELAVRPEFLKLLNFAGALPAVLRFGADVDLRYIQGQGLTGQVSPGGAPVLALQFAQPLNLQLGSASAGLTVEQVAARFELTVQGSALRFRTLFSYGGKAAIGPLQATLDGAGAWLGRWADGTGGLVPPSGVGLSLEAGPVSGGGFLKALGEREFGGALQLKILGIGAFAYGLYKTLPSGQPSLVALIGIRLPFPGVQIGFGFAIGGFGGLVGLNRRADTDLLRERLAGGSSGDVLFNDNPVENAPRLLGAMQQFFPDEQGVFLIGPTFQINWLSLLKLDVGLFIELPGPRKIFIAGSARLVVGPEALALIYLRLDFIGGIDLTKSLIFFDAGLVNSHVLGVFRITGGIALRIAYGSNGYFLFSVGGFHPSFQPGGMELPALARVGTSVTVALAWVKLGMYLALTSNTFQLGARVEAGVEIGPISAHGWFGFDALIQFKPFRFVARVDAGFDVEVFGVSLCSVRIEGELSGPGPLVLKAKASVKILFVRVSASVTLELGGGAADAAPPITDLIERLKGELTRPDNLRAEGDDRSVRLAPQQAPGLKLVAPVGALVWEQRRAPLDLPLQKLEGVDLDRPHTLTVASGLPGEAPEEDWFGVGSYLKLNDSEALNTSRFARQRSGVRIAAGPMDAGREVDASDKLLISLVKLPRRIRWAELFITTLYTGAAMTRMLAEHAGDAEPDPGPPAVTVTQERWNAHGPGGAVLNAQPLNGAQAFAQSRQSGGVALPAAEAPVGLVGVI